MKQPKPTQIDDLIIPKNVDPELYAKGYWHGRNSSELIDFRFSFREGFRKAQIEKQQNNNGRSHFKIVNIATDE